MNKNRKFVSLICALAMVFSMFASFTVVNAADVAMTLEVTDSTATTATIVAKYDGLEGGIAGATVNFTVPAGTKVKSATAGIPGASVTANDTVDGQVTSAVTGLTGNTPATDGATIATFDIEWTADLTEDFTAELLDDASMTTMDPTTYDFTEYIVSDGTLAKSSVTIPVYVDPSKTPAPTPVAPIVTRAPKPTKAPVATEDPEATPVATKAPVEVTKGMTVEVTDVTDTNATVIAKYVDFADGIAGATVNFTVPAGAKVKSAVAGIPGASVTANDTVDGIVTSAVTGLTGNTAATDGATIATFVLDLAAPVENDFIVELLVDASITTMDPATYDFTEYIVSDGTLPRAWTIIPGKSEPEPVPTTAPVPTAKPVSKPVVLPDMDITSDDVPETTNDLYVAVVVKTKDGKDAEYGKDYVAELKLPNGDVKELTKDDLSNILNGYFDLVEGAETMTWADVISGLTFNALSAGLNFNAQLVNGAEVITGGDVEVTFEPEKAPIITLETKVASKKATKVSVGKIMTLTAKTDKVVEGAEYEYIISDSDKAYLEPITATVANDVLTVKFEGKKTKSNIKITVNYLDADDAVLATKSVTVSVVKEETNNGGSSSSTGSNSSSGNSNGSIAHGGVVSNNNNSKVAFVDIDTVPWAEDSILALVDKGVINGRSDSIFDPNGTVTRAEFAKMVVLAFGLTGGSGVDEFSDVENTDWFASYVARGYYNGVISGYDDGTFRPNGLISRQEMAAMIARAVKAANKTLPETVAAVTFEDAYQIADWAMDAVTTLQKGGVINGMTETTYAPLENATRAQAAVIIYRAMTNAK
ncbi:MAG: S-layer homology domain-containing protein [Clostridia bacterium]